jgi:branched-chain amino acid transport system ATP-binding protein
MEENQEIYRKKTGTLRMSEELLNIDKLCKFFGGVKAVNNVSFSVKPGVIKAIIGPNGAGKTTLFNLIAGNFPSTRGNIFFNGKDVTGLPDFKIAYSGIARTFQTTKIFHNMTVLENAMVGRHTRSSSGFFSTAFRLPHMIREERSILKAARKSLDFVGLGHKADHPADTIPFRDQRLLEFARALSSEPKILLADEPAAGLNTRETREIAALIRKIHKSGITVLLVEHDMSLVMDISHEIVVLDYGKKIAEGSPEEIRRNKKVIAVYLGGGAEDA